MGEKETRNPFTRRSRANVLKIGSSKILAVESKSFKPRRRVRINQNRHVHIPPTSGRTPRREAVQANEEVPHRERTSTEARRALEDLNDDIGQSFEGNGANHEKDIEESSSCSDHKGLRYVKKVLPKSKTIHTEERSVPNLTNVETCRATETEADTEARRTSRQQSLSTEKYTIRRATAYERQSMGR